MSTSANNDHVLGVTFFINRTSWSTLKRSLMYFRHATFLAQLKGLANSLQCKYIASFENETYNIYIYWNIKNNAKRCQNVFRRKRLFKSLIQCQNITGSTSETSSTHACLQLTLGSAKCGPSPSSTTVRLPTIKFIISKGVHGG